MLNRKTVSQNNRKLFVKNNGPSGTNLGDLDTELNQKSATNIVKTPSNNIEKLDIPKNNLTVPDINKLKKCCKEWRWRIIEINDKSYAEISYFEPKTKKRFYMSGRTNSWEEQKVDPIYDKHVKEQYFYYT